jgi:hypothetical protein
MLIAGAFMRIHAPVPDTTASSRSDVCELAPSSITPHEAFVPTGLLTAGPKGAIFAIL